MPQNSESFQRRFRSISEASGGAAVAEAFDGGVVVESKYGEFLCNVGPGGELMACFPERGIVCGYLENGDLAMLGLDLSVLLDSLNEKDLSQMVHSGADVAELIKALDEHKEKLFLSIFPQFGSVKLKLLGGGDLVAEQAYEYVDFSSQRFGKITLEDVTVAYSIAREADELMIGLGEVEGETVTLGSVSISHHLDFLKDLAKVDHRDLKAMAEKIILNS